MDRSPNDMAKVPEDLCDRPCEGNKTQMCGGEYVPTPNFADNHSAELFFNVWNQTSSASRSKGGGTVQTVISGLVATGLAILLL